MFVPFTFTIKKKGYSPPIRTMSSGPFLDNSVRPVNEDSSTDRSSLFNIIPSAGTLSPEYS